MPILHSLVTVHPILETCCSTLSKYTSSSSCAYSGSFIPCSASILKENVGLTTTSSSVIFINHGSIAESLLNVTGANKTGARNTKDEFALSFQWINPNAIYATLTPVSSRCSLAFLSIFFNAFTGFTLALNRRI